MTVRRLTADRPHLDPLPLAAALPIRPRTCYVTMSVGQWDALLAEAYRVGYVLLELDDEERPIVAYKAKGGRPCDG